MTISNFNKQAVRAFVDRIENVQEQIDGLAADKKEIYAEAKSMGYDPSIIRLVIADRKKERDNKARHDEQLSLFPVYKDAVDGGE